MDMIDMADIGKPVRRYKVIPVTDPERRSVPTAPPVSPERAPSSPSPVSPQPAEPERV